MDHETEIRDKEGSATTLYEVVCSCGFRDPDRSSCWLVSKADAETSQRWHQSHPDATKKKDQ